MEKLRRLFKKESGPNVGPITPATVDAIEAKAGAVLQRSRYEHVYGDSVSLPYDNSVIFIVRHTDDVLRRAPLISKYEIKWRTNGTEDDAEGLEFTSGKTSDGKKTFYVRTTKGYSFQEKRLCSEADGVALLEKMRRWQKVKRNPYAAFFESALEN